MADQILDSYTPSDPSGDSPSAWSALNRLPTKRFDAAVTRAAEQGRAELQAQTGGYAAQYAHLSHIPLLPLFSEDQQEQLARRQQITEWKTEQMNRADPDKMFTGGQKAFLSVLGHVSGGANIVSTKRMERRLHGAGVWTSNNLMQNNKLIVFTRWTIPAGPGGERRGPTWFVDVLEHRVLPSAWEDNFLTKVSSNSVMLKVGLPESAGMKVTLRLLKTEAKRLKTQKMWSKGFNYDPCEAITFLGENEIVALEIAARIQRACTTIEAVEVQGRFKKGWLVPLVQ